MQTIPLDRLKEHAHGTKLFPFAFYHTNVQHKGTLATHHWHEEVEILYFCGGKFNIEINTEHFYVDSECFYFINPGEIHSIIADDVHHARESALVFHLNILPFDDCDPAQIQILTPLQNGQLHFPRYISPTHLAFPTVQNAYNTILHSLGWQPDKSVPDLSGITTNLLCNQLSIKASLLQILSEITRQELFNKTGRNCNIQIENMKKVINYIKEHYQEKIYIHNLATLVNLNEQYFCRQFKTIFRKTPIEYVNDYRIKQSIYLLKESTLPIMDICLECGFNNLGNFLREFKKHTHTTPSQFRKEYLTSIPKS